MSSHNDKETYLKQVISYVKFPFDRKKIYQELDNHITDRYDDFVCEGDNHDEAIRKAIEIMGDAKDVGTELNKIHNPLLGWIWKISSIALKVVGIVVIVNLTFRILPFVDHNDPLSEMDQDSIIYQIDLDEEARIDDEIITLTDIIYDDDETLHIICSKGRANSILIFRTISSYIGKITDNNGSVFSDEYPQIYRGLFEDTVYLQLSDFPSTSKVLNIAYDKNNRHYEFHVDLNLEDNDA